jgi:branched-chain amino acid transport system substrate-binding protein
MTMALGRKLSRRTTLATGLTAAAGVLVGGPAVRAQAKDVKVALIAPLSGPWARQGELKQKGAQMAIDEINAQGGIKALGGAKMQLVVADAGDSAEKAKNAAQRLVAQEPDLVGGVGAWLSSFTLAVTEVTERAEIPWFSLSYADSITSRGFKYVFQTSPTGEQQATDALPTILELAKNATGKAPKSAGIITDNTAAPLSFAKPMREGGLEKVGVKLVVDETFTPPLSDATSMIQKVRSTRPDFLFLLSTNVSDDKLLAEKLNEFGLGKGRIPVIGNGAHWGAPELLKVAGKDILEGVMITLANWAGKDQADLVKRFKEKTGEPWMGQDSISPYGSYWIIKEALEKAGTTDRRKVNEAIHALSIGDGLVANAFPGKPLKFAENGRRIGAKLVIVQWQNGEPVWVYPPENAVAKAVWPKT